MQRKQPHKIDIGAVFTLPPKVWCHVMACMRVVERVVEISTAGFLQGSFHSVVACVRNWHTRSAVKSTRGFRFVILRKMVLETIASRHISHGAL